MSESSLQGCGDNSCVVARPKGMGTNGGCRCEKRALQAAVLSLRKQLRDAQAAPVPPMPSELVGADRLAGEVCKLVDMGTLDPRSAAGDALLDYASSRHGDSRPIELVRETFDALPSTKPGRRFSKDSAPRLDAGAPAATCRDSGSPPSDRERGR